MSNRAVARRYAKALAQIGEKQGKLADYQQELITIGELAKANADLQRLVEFPLIAPSKRAETFDAVLAKIGTSDQVRTFFKVVAQAARLSLLQDIVASYSELVDEATGVVEAQVASVHALTGSQSQRLSAALSARTQKTIRLKWQQDQTLLGGLKVQLGSTVYDASLQGQLRLLKTRLLTA